MASLPFTATALLAPMEGVTEPCFRDLVLEENPASVLGGAFTEFARVSNRALPVPVLERHLGPNRFDAPVGLQLMGSDPALVAETARHALEAGAPLVDLNFGCPSKGALRGCAGSALLDEPPLVERLVRACTDAVDAAGPVTAKIRAGGEDDALLEDLARAAEAGGAAMLTVHCRTRAEGYQDEAPWERIARAVEAVSIPVCGNGGVLEHADVERMRAATGCAHVMIGRAALADPWIFSGRRVEAAEAADFLVRYAERLAASGRSTRRVAGRLKQLLVTWSAGGLDADGWSHTLVRTEPEALIEAVRRVAAGEEPTSTLPPGPLASASRTG
jgi:tRNA-dihydrouridine synthase C